jgi:hypothetical protein
MEAIVPYDKVLCLHLPGGTDETHEKPVRIAGLRARDLNLGPPKYESAVLTTQKRRSVTQHSLEIFSL